MLPLNLASTGVLKTEAVLEGPELWEGEVGELLAGTLEERSPVCRQGWPPRAPPLQKKGLRYQTIGWNPQPAFLGRAKS